MREEMMTQYNETVERQRLLLEAEKWASGVKSLHAHSFTSMWYDTRGNDGSVMDIEYNNGVVKREIRSTGETVYFGEALTGQALLDSYIRNT
tara:strand:- start:1031 stop:1306 length:276 start_codon:yes stop_codon:yes gene_type:complete